MWRTWPAESVTQPKIDSVAICLLKNDVPEVSIIDRSKELLHESAANAAVPSVARYVSCT